MSKERSAPKESNAAALNRVYAQTMAWVARVSLAVLVLGFVLYLSGAIPAVVPPAKVAAALHEDAHAYAVHHGISTGWGWLAQLGRADMLSLGGLVLLILAIVSANVALVPLLLARRDFLYLALVLAQLAVFAVAASGLIQ